MSEGKKKKKAEELRVGVTRKQKSLEPENYRARNLEAIELQSLRGRAWNREKQLEKLIILNEQQVLKKYL